MGPCDIATMGVTVIFLSEVHFLYEEGHGHHLNESLLRFDEVDPSIVNLAGHTHS